MSLPRLGVFCVGIWLGCIIAFMLNNAALYKIKTNPPSMPLYVAMAVFGGIFGLLTLKYWRYVVICATGYNNFKN